jgi:hypothetical protein
MRIDNHPTQQFESAGRGPREPRSPGSAEITHEFPEDSLTISKTSMFLQATALGAAPAGRESHLARLENLFAADQLGVEPGKTAQVLVWRGFERVQA